MSFGEAYPHLRQLHLSLVTLSVTLFLARGIAVQVAAAWPMARPTRLASVAIDTLLLVSGALLWAGLGLDPRRDTWLGAKLALLLVYIVLGSFALKRARSRTVRLASLVAALSVVAAMATLAIHRTLPGLDMAQGTPG